MSQIRTELHLLRWPLLGLALSLLTAVLTALAAQQIAGQAEQRADAAELAAAHSRKTTQRLQHDEQTIRAQIAAYQALVARGIVGPERRLDWVELMRSVQNERKLLGLEYEIQPRQPWPGTPSAVGGHAFMYSPVKVQIPLLHEEDLLRFLHDVHAQAAAFTRLRRCQLQRLAARPGDDNLAPQLSAECQMDWITLMPEQGAQ